MLRTKARNILVIKPRNIGDVMLTIPVFKVLKEEFPHAKVTASEFINS
ncbi:glycosyltransferase family 9 protein [Thermodesulfovibrio sp. Kuro-1]|nr:glycosyltransferase family 9 protein [Thermodesulfovibrio sp. Kuro-1]